MYDVIDSHIISHRRRCPSLPRVRGCREQARVRIAGNQLAYTECRAAVGARAVPHLVPSIHQALQVLGGEGPRPAGVGAEKKLGFCASDDAIQAAGDVPVMCRWRENGNE